MRIAIIGTGYVGLVDEPLVRGLGIAELPARKEAVLRLAVRLTPAAEIERIKQKQ